MLAARDCTKLRLRVGWARRCIRYYSGRSMSIETERKWRDDVTTKRRRGQLYVGWIQAFFFPSLPLHRAAVKYRHSPRVQVRCGCDLTTGSLGHDEQAPRRTALLHDHSGHPGQLGDSTRARGCWTLQGCNTPRWPGPRIDDGRSSTGEFDDHEHDIATRERGR